jgi:integrase/recombinase XerC
MSDKKIDEDADLINRYLIDLSGMGRTDGTITAYRRVLKEFEGFGYKNNTNLDSLDDITRSDGFDWVESLRKKGYKNSTVRSYVTHVRQFYEYMVKSGHLSRNPIEYVSRSIPEQGNRTPERRDLSIEQMRDFVKSLSHPLNIAIVVMFLKSGIRVGELCNLDMRDIRISNSQSECRDELADFPNSMYIDTDIAVGSIKNSEKRTAANKRKTTTIIPIDPELEEVLSKWLIMRPDPVSKADPLFLSTINKWGNRLTPKMVRNKIENSAEKMGWYEKGGGREKNVTPHYFRHFFTTYMQDRIGDRGIVQYLRGDFPAENIDIYSHNWNNRAQKVYLENIYSLY